VEQWTFNEMPISNHVPKWYLQLQNERVYNLLKWLCNFLLKWLYRAHKLFEHCLYYLIDWLIY
jgi:hypothetical protein